MATDGTGLGDRMKAYEAATRAVLPRRTYTIIRVDGRAFHTLLRKADKPFDAAFMGWMDKVAAALCQEVMGAVFAYTQSDEVSVLATDFGSVHTEAWFGGTVQKMASVAAAAATAEFNWLASSGEATGVRGRAVFDGRVFTVPDPVEVANYFIWRQRDCVRNSISMAAQAHFPHGRLHGLNSGQMQELLWAEKDVNWNDYPRGARRGRICVRVERPEAVTFTDKRTGQEATVDVVRSRWESIPAPRFTASADGWLAGIVPPLPSLRCAGAPAEAV